MTSGAAPTTRRTALTVFSEWDVGRLKGLANVWDLVLYQTEWGIVASQHSEGKRKGLSNVQSQRERAREANLVRKVRFVTNRLMESCKHLASLDGREIYDEQSRGVNQEGELVVNWVVLTVAIGDELSLEGADCCNERS